MENIQTGSEDENQVFKSEPASLLKISHCIFLIGSNAEEW
jgi:hypothetical protein